MLRGNARAEAAARKAPYDVEIAIQEVVLDQHRGHLPLDLLECFRMRLAFASLHLHEEQQQRTLALSDVLVARQFAADGALDAKFLAQFSDQRFLWRLARLDLAAWKLPFQAMPVIWHPLSDQQLALAA